MIHSNEIEALTHAAIAGATEIIKLGEKGVVTSRKADGSLLSLADQASHEAITRALGIEYPGVPILSEERPSTINQMGSNKLLLVVDPLDGTTNFSRGSDIWTVSISLVQDTHPLAAAIYQPLTDDLYLACRGQGAFHMKAKDGSAQARPLLVRRRRLRDAILSVGCDFNDLTSRQEWWRLLTILRPPASYRLRFLECASLEMCWVAANILDCYIHPTDKPWDMCGGGLIVQEAGGEVLAPYGGPWNPLSKGVVAASIDLVSEMKGLGAFLEPNKISL